MTTVENHNTPLPDWTQSQCHLYSWCLSNVENVRPWKGKYVISHCTFAFFAETGKSSTFKQEYKTVLKMCYTHYKSNIQRGALLSRISGVLFYFCDVILNKVIRVALLTDCWCGPFSDLFALLVITWMVYINEKQLSVAAPCIIPKVMDPVTMDMVANKQGITSPVWQWVFSPFLEMSDAARWPKQVILFFFTHTLTRDQLQSNVIHYKHFKCLRQPYCIHQVQQL